MFDHIWDCEIDHPIFEDTVGDLMTEVIQAHNNSKSKSCEDAVSRQMLIRHYDSGDFKHIMLLSRDTLLDYIKHMPSVTPKQKIGEWRINSDGYYPYCSECKEEPKNREMTKYCPNCGAKMGKEQDQSVTQP